MQIIDCLAITAVQCFFVLLTEMPSKPQTKSLYNTVTGFFFLVRFMLTILPLLTRTYVEGRQCMGYIGTEMPRAHCSAPDS